MTSTVLEVAPPRPGTAIPAQAWPRRFEELDSLRGLAAMTVVLHHLLLGAAPAFWLHSALAAGLRASPLAALWSGYEPVVFFFTLSGFVLSLPFFERPVGLIPFGIQRLGRIYVPLLVCVMVAAGAASMFGSLRPVGLSDWVRHIWTTPVTLREVRNHLLMVDSALDPVLWSLAPELAISLVFPLLMLFVVRVGWFPSLLATAGLAVVVWWIFRKEPRYAFMLPSLPMFLIGAIAARHREGLVTAFERLGLWQRAATLVVAWNLYSLRAWYPSGLPHPDQSVTDWLTAFGSCAFIVAALVPGGVRSLLGRWPLVGLGRISYSVYLYHLVILLSLLHILTGRVPLAVIWAVTIAGTLVLATAAQRWIEIPSNRLGRLLAKKAAMRSPGP